MITKRNPNAYSIWLIPNNDKYILLRNIIIDLSHVFEGIKIIPHVTLVSNLDYNEEFLLKKVAVIAKKIRPFNVYFNEIDYLDNFFQSFFLKVKANTQLTNARKLALIHFPEINDNYNPHLSLAYGDKNEEVKRNLKKKIECPVKFFNIKELYLAHNDEINLKWKVIDKFPLAP